MFEWLLQLWASLSANPIGSALSLAGAAVVVWFLTNRIGVAVPLAWRKWIYDSLVSAVGKLLGVDPALPGPPVQSEISNRESLEAFEVLAERCKSCPDAQKPLEALWNHLRPNIGAWGTTPLEKSFRKDEK